MSRKYFEAIGRQHASMNVPRAADHYSQLPEWARKAIAQGFVDQMPWPGVWEQLKRFNEKRTGYALHERPESQS